MESKSLVYAPTWVKATALIVLSLTLVGAFGVAVYYIQAGDRQDWVLVAMSLAQAAASGLAIGLVIFFSERDVNTSALQDRVEHFLVNTVSDAFERVEYPEDRFEAFKESSPVGVLRLRPRSRASTHVQVAYSPGWTKAYYRVRAHGQTTTLLVKVNVYEVVVSHYFPATEDQSEEDLLDRLSWAFSGYTSLNDFVISSNVDAQSFDPSGQPWIGVHFTKRFASDFLEDERSKLFVAQTVAAMTRSLIRDAIAHRVQLHTIPVAT